MKVVIGIATYNERTESIKRTIKSLEGQVDEIRVYDNEVEEVNLTDNGKFRFLEEYKEPIYYFSCDDDIIYPSDYVSKTIEAIEKHQCIVSYHGRILRGLNRGYYRGHSALSCLQTFPQTLEIDVCGTGVTAFRTDYFNPIEIYKAKDKCMSDLVFSLEATKQDKKIMHIGHKAGWITATPQKRGQNIYDRHVGKDTRQTEIANEIWLLKN